MLLENLLNITISPFVKNLILSAQCTSVDAERSFSLLNNLLADNKQFIPENIELYMMGYYNK